jgi:hypothetical protein
MFITYIFILLQYSHCIFIIIFNEYLLWQILSWCVVCILFILELHQPILVKDFFQGTVCLGWLQTLILCSS